ncbi:uncharacterized protein LOC111083019 [Limulus polyphemus]|uniref:Uncharacterized protein LOC111083019 n=1 Tax=Limulus polyphemus TaxID=6850 RepID=A0ABM1SS27_LIMPO|nr:uncharacterized protein LOC111083019 [Limulus polyphemus]
MYFLEDFILSSLENDDFPRLLYWINRNEGLFGIKWSRATGRFTKSNFNLFTAWDKIKGHNCSKKTNYLTKAKGRFRSALWKQEQIKKLKREKTLETLEVRIYRFIELMNVKLPDSSSFCSGSNNFQNYTQLNLSKKKETHQNRISLIFINNEKYITLNTILAICVVNSEFTDDSYKEQKLLNMMNTSEDSSAVNGICEEKDNFKGTEYSDIHNQSLNEDDVCKTGPTDTVYIIQEKNCADSVAFHPKQHDGNVNSDIKKHTLLYHYNANAPQTSGTRNRSVQDGEVDELYSREDFSDVILLEEPVSLEELEKVPIEDMFFYPKTGTG